MLQATVVNLIVLAAAAWLVWTFAPASLRAMFTKKRALPSYDAALQADELAGQEPGDDACACGSERGRR